VVLALVNLSGMVGSRGDTAGARLCLDRAVRLAAIPAIARRLSPMTRVILLADLADVNADQGRPRVAMALFHRALRAAEAELPGHDLLPDLRMSLARVHMRVGDRRRARELLYSSLDHCDTYGCGTWTQGSTLLELGGLALAEGEVDVAEDAYTQALALIQPTMPLTQEHARAWAGLARVARRRGRTDEAERDLRMAVDTIEAARQTAARTDEARALFTSGLYGIYQELVDLLAGQGRTAEAFAALERSHARSLLALLAERRLDEDFDLPPPLAAERKRIASAYDHARGLLREAATLAARQEAEARLDQLRDQHEALAVRIRQQAPSQASFRYPQPLDAPAIAVRLDPGTLLLAYSVGEQETLAFALSVPPDGGPFALRSFTIPAGDAVLRPRVAAWRRSLEQDRPGGGREARAFYDLLMRPVAPEIAHAGRLVLVPDGPLHGLPFAALRAGSRFLADGDH
jgi:tetratricopeptide (TPR) repeat protein